jgi:hypothetical protein
MSDAFVIWRNKSGLTGRVCLRAKTAGTIWQYATQIGCASGQERQGARRSYGSVDRSRPRRRPRPRLAWALPVLAGELGE